MRRLILSVLMASLPSLPSVAASAAESQLQDALRLMRQPAPEPAWAKLQKLQAAHPGLPARALSSLQQRVKQQPGNGEAWFDLGILQVVASEPKAASAAFARAAHCRPHDPYTFAYQGFALIEAGAPQSAMGPLRTALQLDPRNRFAKWALAQAHYRKGDHHQAAKLLNPASRAIRTQSLP
jgi:predicted Zn-dependent protease